MTETAAGYLAIAMIVAIVFASRLGGYLLGARIAEDGLARRLFDVLPGCAIAAVVAPVIAGAEISEMVALVAAVLLLWFSNNMGLALAVGLGLLIGGAHLLAG